MIVPIEYPVDGVTLTVAPGRDVPDVFLTVPVIVQVVDGVVGAGGATLPFTTTLKLIEPRLVPALLYGV